MQKKKVIPKFHHAPCSLCGTPQSRINGPWLRQVRLAAGLSLRDFAKRAGVSAAYICDIEHNRRNCLPEMRANYETFEDFLR